MKTTQVVSAVALVLAFTGVASAQQTTAATAAVPAVTGSVDLGFRGSSVTGDEARWERYRDLRDGLTSKVDLGKETDTFGLRLQAKNIGYKDQQYIVDMNQYGKFKFTAMWNQTPLNNAYNTMTPWMWLGITTNASNSVCRAWCGISCHNTSASTPMCDNCWMPPGWILPK